MLSNKNNTLFICEGLKVTYRNHGSGLCHAPMPLHARARGGRLAAAAAATVNDKTAAAAAASAAPTTTPPIHIQALISQ